MKNKFNNLTSCNFVRPAAIGLFLLMTGCNSPPDNGRAVSLDFLTPGTTSRAEVIKHLGPPSARFERGGILTYRIIRRPEYTSDYAVPRCPGGSWGAVKYSLVLTFDSQDVLQKDALVEVREK